MATLTLLKVPLSISRGVEGGHKNLVLDQQQLVACLCSVNSKNYEYTGLTIYCIGGGLMQSSHFFLCFWTIMGY